MASQNKKLAKYRSSTSIYRYLFMIELKSKSSKNFYKYKIYRNIKKMHVTSVLFNIREPIHSKTILLIGSLMNNPYQMHGYNLDMSCVCVNLKYL